MTGLPCLYSLRKRQAHRKVPALILEGMLEGEERDKPPHVVLIHQLFAFIGSNPEKAVGIYFKYVLFSGLMGGTCLLLIFQPLVSLCIYYDRCEKS